MMMLRAMKMLAVAVLTVALPTTIEAQQGDNYRSLLRNKNVKVAESNLPLVFIDVNGRTIQRDDYTLARMKIIHNGDGQTNYGDTVAHPGQTIDYEGSVALKYRGNSSFWLSDKKPYAFRTLESNVLPAQGGAKKKVNILGMGKDNRWAFIAPWADEVMFRDVLSFQLGRPWMDYVPQGRLCEVFLDGTYFGVYVLCERVSKGKHRLNLEDPGTRGGDLSGDYLVEVDRNDQSCYASPRRPWLSMNDSTALSSARIYYQYKAPDADDWADLPTGARQELQRQISRMEDSFMAPDWNDRLGGYRRWIDPTSFIDYMLATELSLNVDGYRLSTNLYKYSDTRAREEGLDARWKMSLWDFNIAWGNCNQYGGEQVDLWQYTLNVRHTSEQMPVPFYWHRLVQDTAFMHDAKLRWRDYRLNNHSDERLMATVDSLANLLSAGGAAARNEQAWGLYGRSYIWPIPFYAKSFDEGVDYLRSWIRRRLAFMDQKLRLPRDILTRPIAIGSGWNADIVAESLPAKDASTTAIDGADRIFFAESVRPDGSLPQNGTIVTATEGIRFQLSAYDKPQALVLKKPGQTATLTFATPVETSEIFVLATSGNGDSQLAIRLNYADGTSTSLGTRAISDWSVRVPQGDEALCYLGNVVRSSDQLSRDNHYCLYELSLPVEKERPLESVTFIATNTAYATVLALSALAEPAIIPTTLWQQGITDSQSATPVITGIYTPDGRPASQAHRGVVIIRYSDGTSRRIRR